MKIQYKWYTFEQLSGELVYAILQLRQQVFIVEQNCPYLDCDNLDKKSYHLIGWLEENTQLLPVAYLRLIPPRGQSRALPHAPLQHFGAGDHEPGEQVAIGRVLTAPAVRKHGVGRQLMLKGIEKCDGLFPDTSVAISAQQYLTEFYQSLGFRESSDGYLEDGIPHIEMIRSKFT
jgi:ElaA protein